MSDEAAASADTTINKADADSAETESNGVGLADERLAYRGVFQRLLIRPEVGAIIGAAAIWAFFWAVTNISGTAGGLLPTLAVASTLGIMAVAVSLLMIGGEFDLSSGAATGTLGIVTILLVKDVGELGGAGLSFFIALPISLVVALGLGWLNGVVVERTNLPSFIVTLATFFVLRGFKLGFSKKIIDNISVGRADEGDGYEFFRKIFGSTWSRNDHVWGFRDQVYVALAFTGVALLVLAVYELNFQRRKTMNATGLPVFVVGLAAMIGGIGVLHSTDGVSSNVLGAALSGVGALVGLYGLALWRYEGQPAGSVVLAGRDLRLTVGGAVAIALGALVAWRLDVTSQQTVLDYASFTKWPLVLLVGAGGLWLALQREGEFSKMTSEVQRQVIVRVGWAGFISAFVLYGFMYMTTVQGLRSILFAVLALAGALMLAVAAHSARRASPASRSIVLVVFSVSLVALAFFIRSQSTTYKFRSESFTVMLVIAVLLLGWAMVSALFVGRRRRDARADRLGGRTALFGGALLIVGVLVRLLSVTQSELDRGIAPAQFRVEFLWFVGVTVLATLVLGRTKFGSWVFAVGGNKQASRQVGVPASRTKIQLFMIVSVAAWLVGLLLAFRINTIQSGTGNGLEFEYIIAAVVGGTLLTGGYGSAFGAAIGAFIIAISRQAIPQAQWNSDWRFAFLGVILVTAVIANNFIRNKAEASR